MEKNWKEAIIRVLEESEEGFLHYEEITKRVLDNGYYQTNGLTPSASVNAQITSEIKHKGENSLFRKVDKCVFGLNNVKEELISETKTQEKEVKPTKEVKTIQSDKQQKSKETESIIKYFGMYFQRDLIDWKPNGTKILGKNQNDEGDFIDFGSQIGIYILYDKHKTIYIGRSIDRPIGKRLYEHTIDRIGGRWDRFSFFALSNAKSEKGDILNISLDKIIESFEAILIEVVEPSQNRRRGDNFSEIEYIQIIDEDLAKKRTKKLIEDLIK
jgi:hypothetical protein